MVGEDHIQPVFYGERIRGSRRAPFTRVEVSASKQQLLEDLSSQHPEWTVRQYIEHAKTENVTLTPDEVWSALYPI